MAIEIVEFPIKIVIFHSYVTVYQAGYTHRVILIGSKGNHPQMAQQFRLVKYDQIYPDISFFLILGSGQLNKSWLVREIISKGKSFWDHGPIKHGGSCNSLPEGNPRFFLDGFSSPRLCPLLENQPPARATFPWTLSRVRSRMGPERFNPLENEKFMAGFIDKIIGKLLFKQQT